MLENKAPVSCTLMWDIIRLPHRHVRTSLYLDDDEEMIQRIKSIKYICRLTCASCIPILKTSGSELGWDLGFERGFSVGMVLVAPIGYPLRYSFGIFLGLEICNSFGPQEGFLVVLSLGILAGFMIGTV